ncbi:5-carboxymethyl-2-hydroxymuconate Delta-isomerase [Bradyrhizobium sp. WD16]|uniref:5-carboxymethyl-2-hydroxymuconate Delta-isomerase n=1 Tax=Bradyrhizobium sp. WD16 TaxID=1521768 RepID=UPI0020A5B375|nr:5-carboxymethyl-2-hydroxymuconate Delta-isomerase [Bradyrhizobium sp. WD16]UTD25933.1 5-carboxymethyl-2-hydroxymuconate isomerase [Bradyrhizobium sp. WD16]
MPHFTIEYSANLGQRTDIGAVVELVRRSALDTGVFPIGGIRVRAIRCDDYAIGDGNPDLAFLAMVLRMGQGRDFDTRKAAGEAIFEALAAHLEPVFAASLLSLSFEIVEVAELNWKKNNIHAFLKGQAGHD